MSGSGGGGGASSSGGSVLARLIWSKVAEISIGMSLSKLSSITGVLGGLGLWWLMISAGGAGKPSTKSLVSSRRDSEEIGRKKAEDVGVVSEIESKVPREAVMGEAEVDRTASWDNPKALILSAIAEPLLEPPPLDCDCSSIDVFRDLLDVVCDSSSLKISML